MPWRTSRDSVRPKPAVKRKLPIVSAIASFSDRVHTLTLINACACSSAAAWVKCTTYTGACRVPSSSSSVACRGVVTYEYSSGTGRSASLTRAVGRPVRRVRSLPNQLRSEEHTSELQSRENLVCRLLLEKKKETNNIILSIEKKIFKLS